MSEPTGTQYGGFWVRLLAFLADSALVFLVGATLLIGAAMALPAALMPVALAVSALGILYWPVMHASGAQATLGKAIVGLKVTRFDGYPIGILRSLWRELAKIFSAAVFMLGYLMAAFLPRKQGLHDLLAATYVVREGPSRILSALAIAVAGFALPSVLAPMIVDAGAMKALTTLADRMVSPELMKQVPAPAQDQMKRALGTAQDLVKQVVGSAQDWIKQALAPSAPAPAPKAPPKSSAPVAVADAPSGKAEAPKPKVEARAPKAEAPKPKVEAPAPPKPKIVRPTPPPTPTTSRGPGIRYNDIMTATLYGDVASVNELVRQGRWVDKPDSRGKTPLMVAAGLGDLKTAEALLRGGANARRAVPVAQERRDDEMVQLLKRYAR